MAKLAYFSRAILY